NLPKSRVREATSDVVHDGVAHAEFTQDGFTQDGFTQDGLTHDEPAHDEAKTVAASSEPIVTTASEAAGRVKGQPQPVGLQDLQEAAPAQEPSDPIPLAAGFLALALCGMFMCAVRRLRPRKPAGHDTPLPPSPGPPAPGRNL
ncbi:MAG: hypothetical protein V3T77_05755, partial [Planctomycetota bacterium]